MMIDPLSQIIALLNPEVTHSKLVHASAAFEVSRSDSNDAFYCLILSGKAYLNIKHATQLTLNEGDFVLIPALGSFTFSSDQTTTKEMQNKPQLGDDGIYRFGPISETPKIQALVGHSKFTSVDKQLLVSLLPSYVLIQKEARLTKIASLLLEETQANRAAKDAIIEHLLQVLMIEAFRSSTQADTVTSLLAGLADARINPAIRAIHDTPHHPWSVTQLADQARLSRSAFYSRFNRIMGVTPMVYLLNWRMTLAKHMLNQGNMRVSEIADKVGYGSSSAFSSAFTRHVGKSPGSYALLQDQALLGASN